MTRSARLKQIKRIKYIKGIRSKLPDIQSVKYEFLDKQVPGVREFLNLDDSEVEDTWRIMGKKPADYEVAKRVVALKQQFTNASLPERITYDWFTQNKQPFVYQAQLFGGRATKGGILPDFFIPRGGIALNIDGNYWHSAAINKGKDVIQKQMMVGQYINGVQVKKAISAWESAIYRKRPYVFEMALAGIEIGP